MIQLGSCVGPAAAIGLQAWQSCALSFSHVLALSVSVRLSYRCVSAVWGLHSRIAFNVGPCYLPILCPLPYFLLKYSSFHFEAHSLCIPCELFQSLTPKWKRSRDVLWLITVPAKRLTYSISMLTRDCGETRRQKLRQKAALSLG